MTSQLNFNYDVNLENILKAQNVKFTNMKFLFPVGNLKN